MKNWLKEPLLHFLLIGAALFALFYQVADPEEVLDNRIIISETDIDRMITLFERKMQRLPTQQELNGLVDAQIREEILYREALAMGLDQDDTIVRRRMAQKVEFMFNDLVDISEPTEEELQRFLTENPDRFTEAARTSFVHVYLNADRRGQDVEADAQQLLQGLGSEQGPAVSADTGDPFMFGYEFEDQSDHQVSRMFGSEFVDSLNQLIPGRWQGPVVSGYGLHLVYIKQRSESWLPPLAEIRDSVMYEFLAERRQQANQAFYETLRERYEVIVEQAGLQQNMAGIDSRQ
ncbi:MAG: peptidyl-prolyl cis-trans isomerase [Thiotrichales bacterium]|nr:MAG: peptidyl-prolyl cis-trans isomerase [Thiotrichales bacterium]